MLAAYLLLKSVQLYRADADLTVLASKMRPEYFEGRVVWVTGASSGSKCSFSTSAMFCYAATILYHVVGEEMCYQLSRMGAKLILTARNVRKLEEVKSSLANPEDAQ